MTVRQSASDVSAKAIVLFALFLTGVGVGVLTPPIPALVAQFVSGLINGAIEWLHGLVPFLGVISA